MNFLNSSEWRKFQESVGRKTFDLGDGYMIKLDVPFGKSYLYSNYLKVAEYVDEIKKIGRAEGAIFFKYEPMVVDYGRESGTFLSRMPNPEESDKMNIKDVLNKLRQSAFIESSKSLQPQQTIILDLKSSKEELLRKMHQKTRYNIKLAEKRGIKVSISKNKEQDFRSFWNLLQKTAKRDNFHTHTKDYYKKLIDLKNVKLFLAYKEQKIVAGALVIFYLMLTDKKSVNDQRSTATYLHGASDYNYRRDMAPYLLQWEIICNAKLKNIQEYDFWGIDEKKWPGTTRFKRGFGGKEIEYVGSFDLSLQKLWYRAYCFKSFLNKNSR